MMVETIDALGRRIQDPHLLSTLASIAASQVQKNIASGHWAPNAALTTELKGNALPLRDKGHLLASITSGVEGDKGIVGTNLRQARILHDGGVITPKRTRFLAIPANSGTRAFMRQYGATPRACIEGMKSAGYSIYFAKNVVMAKKGKGRPHALFILKRSVTIPARQFMRLGRESVKIIELAAARRIFQ